MENTGNNGKAPDLAVALLAGGSGTRLWPLSTPARPKPFVRLGPLGTLYGATVRRARRLKAGRLFAVGTEPLRPFCRRASVSFLPEPAPRNTAPAVALAAVRAWREAGSETLLLILPCDHHVGEEVAFSGAVHGLSGLCRREGLLGVLAVEPEGPSTAYGYVVPGETLGEGFRVRRFVEKPSREKAEGLLAEGAGWNSGMFLFPVALLREELARHCPGFWEAAEAWVLRGDGDAYRALPSISIDFALLEKTDRAAGIPARFPWSDVGTFSSLYALLPKDREGNAGWGPARWEGCRGCLLISRRPALFRGLSGLAVVEGPGGSLAVPLEEAAEIRAGVEALLKTHAGSRTPGRRR